MLLAGLQKLTLLDFPGHTACTVFTHGCNLRCPFCHNAALVVDKQEETVSEEDFFAFLTKRQGILDGVAVTGGEPLLQKDLPAFLRKIKDMGYAVKLDTNGFFPDRLRLLLADGLVDYVAVDVKNSMAKYAVTVGVDDLDLSPFLATVDLLLKSDTDFEFRTTAVKEFHVPEDFAQIGRLIEGTPRYFIQAFKDSGGLISGGLHPLSKEDMEACKTEAERYVPTQIRGM